MVKIERTPTAPPSLAIESKKANGSYREPDVVEQLKKDFHGKCYICELGKLTDIQIEHLLPHHGGKLRDRMFDWNNLFYSCPHCNSIKKETQYDEKIIDCCVEDPEIVLNHIFCDNEVVVKPMDGNTGEKAIMTADLIERSFGRANTGIRNIQCAERYSRLAKTMNKLYNTLGNFKKDKTSSKYLRTLKSMLKREHEFAAFTRYYVRSHMEDYPELKEFLT